MCLEIQFMPLHIEVGAYKDTIQLTKHPSQIIQAPSSHTHSQERY